MSDEICFFCGSEIELSKISKSKQYDYSKSGRWYCSSECSKEYRRSISSITMARTNRKYASDRMKLKNPMHRQEIRDKVSIAHKLNGNKPKVQGGNGRGLTVPQKMLLETLGNDWKSEFVVKTNVTKIDNPNSYPNHYKIDIANLKNKIAIEVDGNSHNSPKRRNQDRKKEIFLSNNGWIVIRCKNNNILENIDNEIPKIVGLLKC